MDFSDVLGPPLLFFVISLAARLAISAIISLSSGGPFEKKSWRQAVQNGACEFVDAIVAFLFSRNYADSWKNVDEILYTAFMAGAVVSLIAGFVWLAVAAKRKAEAGDDEGGDVPAGTAYGTPTKRAKAEIVELRTGRVLFRLENGQQLMLNTSLSNYKVGQIGMLMWQGNRVISFDRLNVTGGMPQQPVQTTMQMIRCPVCNTEQKAGRRICFQCGHTFTPEESRPKPAEPAKTPEKKTAPESACKFCSDCGAEIRPDMKFCAGCGKPLTQPEPVVFCHNCGLKQTYGDGKCTSCGTELVKKD